MEVTTATTKTATMSENEHTTDAQPETIETLTEVAEELHQTDADSVEITTEAELVDYLGLDGIPRQDSANDVILLTTTECNTINAKHRLYQTPDHGWTHVRTTTKNVGEHRMCHYIKHIGKVTYDPRGIDVDYLLARCEARGIGIDESHAETIDEWVQREAEVVADYRDDVAAVTADGTSLYLETFGRRLGNLRSEIEYVFADKKWDVFRAEVSGAIDTRSPGRLARDVSVDYVVDLEYERPY